VPGAPSGTGERVAGHPPECLAFGMASRRSFRRRLAWSLVVGGVAAACGSSSDLGGLAASSSSGGGFGQVKTGGVGGTDTGGMTSAGVAGAGGYTDAGSEPADADSARIPANHRAAGSPCPTERATGTLVCQQPDGGRRCEGFACSWDSDCVAGANGRCVVFGPGPPAPVCSYDECFEDADCPAGVPCECRSSASSVGPNQCATGSDCRVDSDCGPSGYCSPSLFNQWCGWTYHCHTPADTCVNDVDCDGGVCWFDAAVGHWACGAGCGPPPP
jgi:hypothetical protein